MKMIEKVTQTQILSPLVTMSLKDLAAMAPQIASRIQEKRFFARPHGKV
jgi:adenylyl- and sulfurtransferase ThiI